MKVDSPGRIPAVIDIIKRIRYIFVSRFFDVAEGLAENYLADKFIIQRFQL